MKLDKKDNLRLLNECCIVSELQSKTLGTDHIASAFGNLSKYINSNDNLTYSELHEKFDDSHSVRTFLNTMEKGHKFFIARDYYKRAIKIAKKTLPKEKSDQYIKDFKKKFLRDFDIDNLRVRYLKGKYTLASIGLAVSMVAGTLGFSQPTKDPIDVFAVIEQSPTPTYSPKPTSAPTPDLSNEKNCIKNFKELYLEKYNKENNTDYSPNDIKIKLGKYADYIYKVNIDNNYRYITHGNHPKHIENYLKAKNIEYSTIFDVSYDEIIEDPECPPTINNRDQFGDTCTKVLEYSLISDDLRGIKLYDGNYPDELFETEKSNSTILSSFDNFIQVIRERGDLDLKKYKTVYTEYMNNTRENKENKSDKELEI